MLKFRVITLFREPRDLRMSPDAAGTARITVFGVSAQARRQSALCAIARLGQIRSVARLPSWRGRSYGSASARPHTIEMPAQI
jgi:hypothetical protein